MLKLNKLLALVEASTPVFRKLIAEYKVFFEKKQGEFKGIRKTYSPREGTKDEPSMHQFSKVVTTVPEKLDYFKTIAAEHINSVLAVEATNASGTARAELKVGELSFGKLSTLELMKLRSILEKEGLEPMYATMPVRSDAEIWYLTTDEMYNGRDIYETPLQKGESKTTEKEECILVDPNLKNMTDTSKYIPVKSMKSTTVTLGDYTLQSFSGETTYRYRAGILARRSALIKAIEGAIKDANDVPTVRSELIADKLFKYLHDSEG